MAGVFVTRGMTWGTPGVVISLDEAGKSVGGSMAIQVHFDVGPTWLQIALHHLEDAKVKQLERVEAWKGTDQKAKAAALEGEFETSMQAIMVAAIAIDAFYAVVQTKTKLPAHLITSWRAKKTKKTARYAQICEVLRLAFSLRPQATRVLRQNLRAIYKLRDKAIHPTGKLEAPVLHPELQVRVEWRFSDFRFENAYLVVRETLNMLCELVTSGKPQNGEYAEAVRPKLEKFKKAEVLAKHPHPVPPTQ